MSDPIKFYKGEETGIVHENYSDINTSLFKDQYLKALNEIGEYFVEADNWSKNHTADDEFDINNIFAFIGERGTGKTSCMESVADIIKAMSDDRHNQGQIIKSLTQASKYSAIDQKRFQILKPIDPTTFDDKSNILEVVVGKLFEEFQKSLQNKVAIPSAKVNDCEYEYNKRITLNSFQEVMNCIKYVTDSILLNGDSNDVTQLAELSSVLKLKSLFKNLIDNLLQFYGKDILVLQIDDIDLQSQYAYTMLEQIRKYFIQKNVIILLAVKMEQLSLVVELNKAKLFEPLLLRRRISMSEITDMAARYLLKLVPVNHRIYMPIFDVYSNAWLQYYNSRESENPSIEWSSVKYAVTSLIYRKCRFLFYHSKGVVSPIVPTNLRELRHLIEMLVEMKDYYNGSKDDSHQRGNKLQFLNYLNSTWVNNNLTLDYLQITNILQSVKDAASINKTVIQILKSVYKDITNNEAFITILNPLTVSYNISVADVFVVIEYIKARVFEKNDKMLIFYIETFYSIKLYEYYDEYTDALYVEQKDSEKTENSELQKVHESIRKREIIDGISNYEILIGGSFINTEYYRLLPQEKGTLNKLISRDNRRILYEPLKNEAIKFLGPDKEKIEEKDIAIKDYDSVKLQMLEFIALCISRPIDASDSMINSMYRTYDRLYYDFDNSKSNKYVLFNIGAFFFNILNVKRAYGYIHSKLFDYASKSDNSLYSKLLIVCSEDREYYKEVHSLLSCVAIRNFEILADFIHQIEFDKFRRSESSSNRGNIAALFEQVEKYEINTYDLQRILDPYHPLQKFIPSTISFSYAKEISTMLRTKNKEKTEQSEAINYDEFFDSLFVEDYKNKVLLPAFDEASVQRIFKNRSYRPIYVYGKLKKKCFVYLGHNPLLREWWNLNIEPLRKAGKQWITRESISNYIQDISKYVNGVEE